jgi:hypothetical protein
MVVALDTLAAVVVEVLEVLAQTRFHLLVALVVLVILIHILDHLLSTVLVAAVELMRLPLLHREALTLVVEELTLWLLLPQQRIVAVVEEARVVLVFHQALAAPAS